MNDRTYKIIELTGTSTDSIEKAVNNALARASETLRDLKWFQVIETRGRVDADRVTQWQVTLKVGFALE